MARTSSISAAQARRIALAANGLTAARPTGRVDRRHLRRVTGRLGLIQLDSVNVCVRTQYLTVFSRLGEYDPTLLDRMAYDDHELFEYWGHVASLVRVEHQPLLRWRMAENQAWIGSEDDVSRRPDLLEALAEEVLTNGPVTAAELDTADARKGAWWGWSDTKRALEHLFSSGRISARRRGNFERVYCAPGDAVPETILALPTPAEADAKRELVAIAARAHGIGTARDLADYWRLGVQETARLARDLVEDGRLEQVTVQDWKQPAYRHRDAALPRSVDVCAIVSPFDQVMWERDRVSRLFGFDYRIEIYVPKPARVYGYYVLPFLLGDTFVGRIDCKADRAGRRLLVQAAHAEPDLAARGTDLATGAERLSGELRTMATWLDLDDVSVVGPGNLAPALSAVSST